MKWQWIHLVIVAILLSLPAISSTSKPGHGRQRPASSSASFLHLTDVHVDPLYITGGSFVSACHRRPEEVVEADTRTVIKLPKKKHNLSQGYAGEYGSPLSGWYVGASNLPAATLGSRPIECLAHICPGACRGQDTHRHNAPHHPL